MKLTLIPKVVVIFWKLYPSWHSRESISESPVCTMRNWVATCFILLRFSASFCFNWTFRPKCFPLLSVPSCECDFAAVRKPTNVPYTPVISRLMKHPLHAHILEAISYCVHHYLILSLFIPPGSDCTKLQASVKGSECNNFKKHFNLTLAIQCKLRIKECTCSEL